MNGSFDWTPKIGDLLTVISAAIVAASFLFRKGGDYAKLQMSVSNIVDEIVELKKDVSKIGQIMTQVAVQNERMDNMGQRMNMMDRRYDELRRGQGYVQERDAKSVDREY